MAMRSRNCIAFGASVMSLATATPVTAQEAETGFSDDTIIVQARRRDESIQDVPVVVQAVTAQELTDLNIREFKDIQSIVPGLSMGQDSNGIGSRTTLRGVNYDVNASGNNGTVEFYMNDAPLSAGILFQSMFDVGQVEVLRGPQGTLRGRASPSGSITVTTRRPDLSEAGGYMTGTVNDIKGWNVNGAVNVPLIADKLAIRVAGLVDENQGDRVRSVNVPGVPTQIKNRAIRASVQFEPFDILSLFFAYTNTDRKARVFDQVETLDLSAPGAVRARDRKSVLQQPRTWSQNFTVFNWQAELRLLGQKLNYVGSYNDQDYLSYEPMDKGSVLADPFSPMVQSVGMHTNVFGSQQNHEVRLSSDERVAGMFDYVVGYLWNKLNAPTDLINDSPVLFGGPTVPTANDMLLKTPIARRSGQLEKSYFANITAHITDATEISGGIRRIKYHSEGFLGIGGRCGADPLSAACIIPASVEDRDLKATIYSASLKHRFSESLMAYASYGSSWRPGSSTGPTALRNLSTVSPALKALYFPDAEKSDSYEIGVKSNWLDNRLRVNISAYHQRFKNFAYAAREFFVAGLAGTGAERVEAPTQLTAGVPAKVSGVEAEFDFKATPNWSLGAVLSYSKSRIQNGTVPCNDFFDAAGNNVSDGKPDGSRVPTYQQIMNATGGAGVAMCQITQRAGLSAPFTGTFQTEYSYPVNDSMDAYLRGFVTYYGKSQNSPINPVDDVKAYALVNLYAGVRDQEGGWEVGLYGKNVLNTQRTLLRNLNPEALSYLTAAFAGAVTASKYRLVGVTAPREFGLTARISFGSQ